MRRVFLVFALTALCSLAVAAPAIAKRSGGGVGYTLVGSATLVSPGHNSPTGVQLTSTESGASLTWGAIGFAIAPGLRLRQVNTLATDYEFLDGSCWDGSPRFTVGVSRKAATTAETYFYIGPPPNYTGPGAAVEPPSRILNVSASFTAQGPVSGCGPRASERSSRFGWVSPRNPLGPPPRRAGRTEHHEPQPAGRDQEHRAERLHVHPRARRGARVDVVRGGGAGETRRVGVVQVDDQGDRPPHGADHPDREQGRAASGAD